MQVFANETEGAELFGQLERRWARENGTDGHKPEHTPILAAINGATFTGGFFNAETKWPKGFLIPAEWTFHVLCDD